ncbi:MAG: T9SS type A sorting domain-containing protein [Candidatus Hatepunaea meridiana]|nr:T9SS type A sorting domain-containing protein [Candidatus Hatepunaea meridiana]
MTKATTSIKHSLYLTLFTLLIAPAFAQAQDSLGITKLSSYYDKWENAADIAVLDDYAYVASGRTGLRILDISDADSFREVISCRIPGQALGVSLMGDLACVTSRLRNVHIVDISEPLQPEFIGVCECRNVTSRAVALEGFVYVPTSGGLEIFDVSNPREPALAATYNQAVISELKVRNGLAYISGRGLRIIDISDLEDIHEVGVLDEPGSEAGVIIVDNLAIVEGSNQDYYGFRIVDIEDPANPHQVGFFSSRHRLICYTADEEKVYYGTGGRFGALEVADISNPEEPQHIGSIEIDINFQQSAIKSGGLLFITGTRAGGCIKVLDITDIDNPIEISDIYPLGYISETHIKDNFVLAACKAGGLRILDISEPDQPEEVSAIDTDCSVYGMDLIGDMAVLAEVREGIAIVDVTNPREPNIIGRYNDHFSARDVVLKDSLVFVVDSDDGLRILDITDPQQPTEVSIFEFEMYELLTVSILGNIAYLGTRNNLTILDISDIRNPRQIGVCEDVRDVNKIAHYGNYIFAADTMRSTLIDVENPENPQVVHIFEDWRNVNEVSIIDHFAVISEKYYGIRVLNISNPIQPHEVGFYPIEDRIWNATITNEHKIIVGGEYHLTILDAAEALSISESFKLPPASFILSPAYPNPFNSTTMIRYSLPFPTNVSLGIYNPLGRKIDTLFEGYRQPGIHTENLNAVNLVSGLYYVRLESSKQVALRKVMLIK